MATEQLAASPPDTARRPPIVPLGWACVLSGVLGLAMGVFTLAGPRDPGVPADQWSHPFSPGVQWGMSAVLALAHALTALGVLGLLRLAPHGRSRAAAAGLWLAFAGLVGLSVCEVLSGAIGAEPANSSLADGVSTAFGVTSLAGAIGSVVSGVVIVRAGRMVLAGWAVLASGLIMILLVTPANIIGEPWLRMPALTLWSLCFVPLGLAVAGTGRESAAGRRRRTTS